LKVTELFSYVTNTQALQQKSEKQRNQRLVGLIPDYKKKLKIYEKYTKKDKLRATVATVAIVFF
jgi:hypothetical protein